uniref:Large ribosomal subunit protein uL22c n=1 Tax=Xylocarpus rumphii TaxID=1962071 RepID=A0A2Z4WSQ5_9ROSI|nr:ribosomal protein L22 [Xylocarpus rumphii]AXA07351.1 ribosomal protein L22 [Xylocarpus rumphii]
MTMIIENTVEVYALGQHICMSAHKARRIIDQIRGRSYEETLMILELMPYRASYPILKLVYSAAANGIHNLDFNKTSLFIIKAEVNEGTAAKRLKPRARGRSYLIKRPTCHITIGLRDISIPKYEYEDYGKPKLRKQNKNKKWFDIKNKKWFDIWSKKWFDIKNKKWFDIWSKKWFDIKNKKWFDIWSKKWFDIKNKKWFDIWRWNCGGLWGKK